MSKEEKIIKVTKSYAYQKEGRKGFQAVLEYKDEKGKRKYITKQMDSTINGKRKAEAKLKEIVAEYDARYADYIAEQEKLKETPIIQDNNVFFIDYLRKWLEAKKSTIAGSTYDGYLLINESDIIPYFRDRNPKLKDITPDDIEAYVAYKLKKQSGNTVAKQIINMNQCFKKALKQRLIPYNPVSMAETPTVKKFQGSKVYGETEIKLLGEILEGDSMEVLIILTLFFGLRRSEVLGLKFGAIDFNKNQITIRHTVVKHGRKTHKKDLTKTDSSYRILPLTPVLADKLKKLYEEQKKYKALNPDTFNDEDYVFAKSDGVLYSPTTISSHFKELLRKNKDKLGTIRFHDLRHSAATYLICCLGFNVEEVQQWMGHANIQTTLLYTHFDMSTKDKIGAKLNEKFETLVLQG